MLRPPYTLLGGECLAHAPALALVSPSLSDPQVPLAAQAHAWHHAWHHGRSLSSRFSCFPSRHPTPPPGLTCLRPQVSTELPGDPDPVSCGPSHHGAPEPPTVAAAPQLSALSFFFFGTGD